MWTSYLYSLIVADVTDGCYRTVLDYVRPGSRVLDVGIGNGAMIKRHHRAIVDRQLRIVGLDINPRYLAHCDQLVRTYGLRDRVQLHELSVEDYAPSTPSHFDYILFSMSFMLMDDQRSVLARVLPWLTPHGEILFVQTMFRQRSRWLEFIKPRLKYLTTIDFGQVTYEAHFFSLLDDMGLVVAEDRVIKKECFRGEYRMVAARADNGTGLRDLQCEGATRLDRSS
jgi:ubiquinone/menaquinone biosynthesis C-methylase UbiE